MIWIIGVAGTLALALIVLLLFRRRSAATDPPHFRRAGSLFGPGEVAFRALLKEATGDQFLIYPKIGLGALVTPQITAADGSVKEVPLPADLAGVCVDYVLCSKDDHAVIAVITLQPPSAPGEEASPLPHPVEDALASAEISLARFERGRQYGLHEVQNLLATSLSLPVKIFSLTMRRLAETTSTPPAKEEPRAAATSPLCPECSAAMAQRRANQGKFAGKLFWVCSRFPQCRKVVPIAG